MNLMGYLKLGVVVIVLLGAVYGIQRVHQMGYDKAAAEWSTKYTDLEARYAKASLDEAIRQAQANADAKKKEAERLSILVEDNARLEALIGELQDEASTDPDADRISLSNDSRLRIDKVH